MNYFVNSEINKQKFIFYLLKNIYGFNSYNSMIIIKKLGYSYYLKLKYLSNLQIKEFMSRIKKLNCLNFNSLKKTHYSIFKNLINIKGFPLKGQRTHTNAKTVKKNEIFKIEFLADKYNSMDRVLNCDFKSYRFKSYYLSNYNDATKN